MGLNPTANRLERGKYAVQQTFRDEPAQFFHDRRRACDTEQFLEPVHERVNDMLFQPPQRVREEVLDTFKQAVNDVLACFLDTRPRIFTQEGVAERVYDILHNPASDVEEAFAYGRQQVPGSFLPVLPLDFRVPPLLNICAQTTKKAAQELNCRPKGSPQECEETLGDTCEVNVRDSVLEFVVEQGSQFLPVVLVQPLRTLVKDSDNKVTETPRHQSPVQFRQETDDNIREDGHLLHQQSAYVLKVDFLKTAVEQFRKVLTYVGEVDSVQEPVGRLHGSVDTVADFVTQTRPVHRVHNLIDFLAQERTQLLPVCVVKRLFQLVGKVADIVINRQFFKHGTVVGSTATASTAAPGVQVVLNDIEFVNTNGETLEGFLRSAAYLVGSVTVGSFNLLRRRVGTLASQTGKKLVEQVEQCDDFIYHKVNRRGNSVDDRSGHSRQRVLEVQCAAGQVVHALGELRTHDGAVLVEVVDTLLKPLGQRGNRRTYRTIHSNPLQAGK